MDSQAAVPSRWGIGEVTRGAERKTLGTPNSARPAPEPKAQSKAQEAVGLALLPKSIHIYTWQQLKYQVYCFWLFESAVSL